MKKEIPGICFVKCLLRLSHQNLISGNLGEFQEEVWKEFEEYSGTIMIIRSDFDKNIAFFIPNKFEITEKLE
jgi:hypothetical protein